jgi:hypothetical protein
MEVGRVDLLRGCEALRRHERVQFVRPDEGRSLPPRYAQAGVDVVPKTPVSQKPPELTLEVRKRRAIKQAALAIRNMIRRRAFPTTGKPGLSKTGKPFKKLSPGYQMHKLRKGRHGVPDQRLSSRTARALKVIQSTETRAVVGFVGRQAVAANLQKRNKFFGIRPAERKLAVDIAAQTLKNRDIRVDLDPRTIVVSVAMKPGAKK